MHFWGISGVFLGYFWGISGVFLAPLTPNNGPPDPFYPPWAAPKQKFQARNPTYLPLYLRHRCRGCVFDYHLRRKPEVQSQAEGPALFLVA